MTIERQDGQEIRDDLPAQDENLFDVLELVPHEKREVEQGPADEEVEANQNRGGRQQIERKLRASGQREHRGVWAVRRDEGEDFPSRVHQAGMTEFPQPHDVRNEHSCPQCDDHRRGPDARRADERGNGRLGEVGVLAQADGCHAQHDHRGRQDHRRDRLQQPAKVGGHGGDRRGEAADPQDLGVTIEESLQIDGHRQHRRPIERLAKRAEKRSHARDSLAGEHIDQRASHHDTVGQLRDIRGLCGRADPEAHGDRQRRCPAQLGDRVAEPARERRRRARHAETGDEIDEPLRPRHGGGDTFRARGRRDQADQIERARLDRRLDRRIASGREVGQQKPRDAEVGSLRAGTVRHRIGEWD